MGTRRACTNPPLASRRKAAGPTFEYALYSRSSIRFSRTSESRSLRPISKIPSTGSRQPRSISRSVAVRSGRSARNWSRTVLPFGRRRWSANRSMTPIAWPPLSSCQGSVASSMNCSSCRSNRGLSAKSTRARFSSALRSMREASDGAPVLRFMARGAMSFLRPAERGQLAVDLGQVERLRFFGVVLAPVLHRGVAFVGHADRVVLAPVARERLLQRDLVLPACPEVVGVADLAGVACHGIAQPDRLFVAGPVEVHERVAVLFLPRLEHVQVVAIPAEQHLDDVVQVAKGGRDRQPHPAPDRRTGAGQRDLQLSHLVDAARRAGGGELRHRLREFRSIRVTGGPHLGEA